MKHQTNSEPHRFGRCVRRALLACLACVSVASVAASAAERINVGINVSWPGYAFLQLADRMKLDPDYDYHMTIFEDPLAGHSALAAGQIDVYLSPADYTPMAIASGTDEVLVAPLDISYGVDQVVTGGANSAADIRGQKVAAPEAYIGEILTGMWLDSIGLKVTDVTLVNMNADEAAGPMISGALAVSYMYEPWSSKVLTMRQGASVVARTDQPQYLRTGMFLDSMYMNRKFIAKRRGAALHTIRARFDGLQYWHDHTTEANEEIAKFLSWPVADVESVIGINGKYQKGGLYMLDFDEAARICGELGGEKPLGIDVHGNGLAEIVQRTNEWWVRLGLMQKVYKGADGVDCSLIGDLVNMGFEQALTVSH